MHIVDVIGFTVVGVYLLLVAASNNSVRGVTKVSAKTVRKSFKLAEKAYDRYLESSDKETEDIVREIKRKVKTARIPHVREVEKPKDYEFIL